MYTRGYTYIRRRTGMRTYTQADIQAGRCVCIQALSPAHVASALRPTPCPRRPNPQPPPGGAPLTLIKN